MSYKRLVQKNPELTQLMSPKWTKYIPHKPYPKQHAFLWLDDLEVFYGGAVGGGKSDALLMAALQYVDIPGYNAVLIRDTCQNLSKPEGLLTRAHEWLHKTDAHWKGAENKYVFPSGATISFSYLDGPLDHFNHMGAAYQFVGIDEIVSIRENQATFMFSRMRTREPEPYKDDLRNLTEYTEEQIEYFCNEYNNIPLRFRCASNPPLPEQIAIGGWVKRRYVDKTTRGDKIFIPAGLDDNPAINKDKYVKSLNMLDPITRQQLLNGDWDIHAKGRMFDRSWFPIVEQPPANARTVRFYDPAHTEPKLKSRGKGSTDPDYFCGCRMSVTEQGLIFIEHMSRWRKSPLKSKSAVLSQSQADGKSIEIYIEREPAAGTNLIDDYVRLLAGWAVRGRIPPAGHKHERAMALASYAEAGNVYLVNGGWINDFLEEIEVFPDGEHDDQLVACSGAFNELTGKGMSEVNVRWI